MYSLDPRMRVEQILTRQVGQYQSKAVGLVQMQEIVLDLVLVQIIITHLPLETLLHLALEQTTTICLLQEAVVVDLGLVQIITTHLPLEIPLLDLPSAPVTTVHLPLGTLVVVLTLGQTIVVRLLETPLVVALALGQIIIVPLPLALALVQTTIHLPLETLVVLGLVQTTTHLPLETPLALALEQTTHLPLETPQALALGQTTTHSLLETLVVTSVLALEQTTLLRLALETQRHPIWLRKLPVITSY